MQKTLFLTAALAVLGMVNARSSDGVCSTPELQAGFDATKYIGTWFNAATDKNAPYENGNCEQSRLSPNADGTLRVYNSQFGNETKAFDTADATATCVGPRCSVAFFWWAPTGDYRVVETDYENYALVYSCKNGFLAPTKTDFATILTRAQNPKQEYIDKALATLKARVPEYTTDNFKWTYQGSACQYLKDETISSTQ
jgi:lipocalin